MWILFDVKSNIHIHSMIEKSNNIHAEEIPILLLYAFRYLTDSGGPVFELSSVESKQLEMSPLCGNADGPQ
ncbi:hypothetical protein TNIN_211271 [Trichonephila inaurata madagascariensis]|uniref:Uncharacterized protein n=1 Tax=Trichonephila inaurata madagascariensis TaxID=2747483 RepID=A0A8X6XZQ2_9ARAC|nr:hypothetical protein TNIN_211271 [Trichonephila inaurata madagascariensis]